MQILYEDARIVLCVKPAGVLSTDEEGGMPTLLRARFGTPNGCFKTVHRLDAAAAGVMVFARSHKAASLLSEQIRDGQFRKEYLAVIAGHLPQKEGIFEDHLRHDRLSRQTGICRPEDHGAKRAELCYRVLEENAQYSLVHIVLLTGRTHQIRVQFSSRGFPLVGEKKYADPVRDLPLALWSCRISFLHPQTNEPVSFSLAPPDTAPWSGFEKRCLP